MLGDLILLIIKWLFIIAIIWTFVTFLFSPRRSFGNIHSRWHTSFDFQLSVKDFYESVEEAIRNTGVNSISIDCVQYSTSSHVYLSQREYLQVRREDQMFLICAAPFGKGFFVSWWMGKPINFIEDLITRIPKVGPAIAAYMYRKSFYEMDTDSMFRDCISNCVKEIVNKMTNEHGTRLSESDFLPMTAIFKDQMS